MALVAEQRREARTRVEAREAKPIDRPVAPDEGRRMRVPDYAVILDPLRQSRPPSRASAERLLPRGAGLTGAASHLFGMWQDIFDLQVSAGEKVLRAILIYVFLIAILRIVGKRELGQANTLDLVVLLLVANAVQNGIIGNDLSVTGAVIGAVTLFAINELVNRTTYAFPWAARALEGDPTLLISQGKPIHKALRRAGISLSELRASARREGFPDLAAVHTAVLETNGIVTMFREGEPAYYHPAEPGGLRIGKRRRSAG